MIFEEYVEGRGQGLLRLAYVLTEDVHLAEDLVQTVLVDVFRKWRTVESASNMDAYIRRMLINSYLTTRRRRSWFERPTATFAEAAMSTSPDHAIAVERSDETLRLLRGLAPKARTVLILRYYADLDDAAIAEIMGIHTSTVRSTASRALEKLRESISTASLKEDQ